MDIFLAFNAETSIGHHEMNALKKKKSRIIWWTAAAKNGLPPRRELITFAFGVFKHKLGKSLYVGFLKNIAVAIASAFSVMRLETFS